MKKLLLLLISLVLLLPLSYGQSVSVDTASNTAKKWLAINGTECNEFVCAYTATDAQNRDLFYIFNGKEANAFVIVSADQKIKPILGYSTEGMIDINNMPVNAAEWLDGYKEEIEVILNMPGIQAHQEWKSINDGTYSAKSETAVNPLLTTNWDQGWPYNAMCPGNSMTGCVATAMAQVMKYWEHPIHGYGSSAYYHATYGVLSANYGETYYNWNNMPNQCNTSNPAVATLMFHCGVSVQMDYSPQASGAYTENVPAAFKQYFGYSSECVFLSKDDYTNWADMVKAELDASRPMLYRGNSNASGGHAFVCDGYNTSNFFHFNWGWSGYANGYFSLSNLNPSGYNFNSSQGAVMYCEPDWTLYCNEPNNLVVASSGNNIIEMSWSAPDPSDLNLEGYQIEFDGEIIGTTTGTEYSIENVCYGVHSACVHAMYDNGCVSETIVCETVEAGITPNPSDFAGTANGSNVTLTWTAPECLGTVTAYNIYRDDDLLDETEDLTYLDSEVINGTHNYCIEAVYGEGNVSDQLCTEIAVDEECIAPTGLNASLLFGKYYLSWTAPEGKNFHSYNVYRNSELLASDITETQYTDTPTGIVYTYGVTGVYTSCESDPSIFVVTVGIDDINRTLAVYPNPANDKITVEGADIISVSIYNMLGQSVKTVSCDSNSTSIDIKGLSNGIYMLDINTVSGSTRKQIAIQ
ncbi:MAG: thiol protease/hemagglutinin PrtT [Bacteroidales bacterium]|nr:thiol protease/hemagglutinin PrtT [Bacteroidales bacterium]